LSNYSYPALDAYLSVQPSGGVVAYYKNAKQQFLNNQFADAPNVFSVQHTNWVTGITDTVLIRREIPFRARLNKDEIDLGSYCKLLFQNISYVVYLGDIFDLSDGYKWICVDVERSTGLKCACVCRRCNNYLKYYDSNHVLQQIPCYISNKVQSLQVDKEIILPKNQLHALVPFNTISNQLRLNNYDTTNPYPMRFMLNNISYRIFSIDMVSNITTTATTTFGYIDIDFITDMINESDDQANGIAFNGYMPSFAISILNSGSNNNVQILHSSALQLDVQVTDNDVVIIPATNSITYTSSNHSIAAVNANGLITTGINNGSCIITATYNNNSTTISANLIVYVVSSLSNNYAIEISGSDNIKVTQTSQYNCAFLNNGVIYLIDQVEWSLLDDDGVNSTTLASIAFESSPNPYGNNFCEITANSLGNTGWVRLYAQSTEGAISYIRIQIVPLI